MSYSETVIIEMGGKDFDCEVEFNFYKGEPAITHLLPENCQEGSPDEYEITGLFVQVNQGHATDSHDIGFLIEDFEELIVEQLEDIRNERF